MSGSNAMCRTLRRLGAAMLLWLPVAARAADAQDGDCEMALSTASVDYGRVSRATMAATTGAELLLPQRTLGMTIRCREPREMTVFFRSAPAGADAFRFAERGQFTLRLRDAVIDGERVRLGDMDGNTGTPRREDASLPWLPGAGLAPLKKGKAVTGRVFAAQLDIEARVEDGALNVHDATRWLVAALIDAPMAGVSRELALQADVIAGSCHVDVTRHISFGRIRSTELAADGAATQVPSAHAGQLQVVCDGPMPLAFRVRDERAGTAAIPANSPHSERHWLGLGKTPAGENIGAYVMHWAMTATSDRGELYATRSLDGGRTWSPAGAHFLAEREGAERVGYAGARDATAGPLPVTALNVNLDATIYIAPKTTLSIDDDIEADGLATFEIIY